MAGVPFIFGNATTSIPLTNLDANFNTGVTIGNTTVGLGNTVTTLGNVTLNNVTITSGSINAAVTQSGFTANAVIYSNTSGNLTTSANLTFDGSTLTTLNTAYTGTLTGGTGIVNLGSGQFYKDASGNIGVGAAPAASARKAIQITDAAEGYFLSNTRTALGCNYYYDGSLGKYMQNGYATFYEINSTAGTHLWYTAASGTTGGTITLNEAMRIDSSNNLLVGQTSNPNTAKFAYTFNGSSASGLSSNDSAGASGSAHARWLSNGTIVGSITTTSTATLYNVTSDYRLKTVIAPVSDAGTRLDLLEPIEYDFKNGGRTRGFLAHKFAEVYPNSVSGEKDAVDKEGKPVYQAMQASSAEVMADLIAEIQSLRKRVAQLESK